MRRSRKTAGQVALRLVIVTSLLLFFCEFALYPIVIHRCSWPSIDSIVEEDRSSVLKGLFIADTHLLGPIKGHWFDKLRREWQMHRAFVTAVDYFRPDVVFFLGDLFDEGQYVNQQYFDKYVTRFASLFPVPDETQVFVVPGNHDVGFHNDVRPITNSRFKGAFNTTALRVVRLKEVNFVLVNSMAVEMDGCFLCREGIEQLNEVENELGCQNKEESKCKQVKNLKKVQQLKTEEYSPPIILQHFPMYRKSDAMCEGEDAPPESEKTIPFKPSHDCLSQDSTRVLLSSTQPRLILSGHTHHYCVNNHTIGSTIVPEVSVPSFSWRNRNNPSFILGILSKGNYHLSKCFMPRESTVKGIYAVGLCIYFYILFPVVAKILHMLRLFLRK